MFRYKKGVGELGNDIGYSYAAHSSSYHCRRVANEIETMVVMMIIQCAVILCTMEWPCGGRFCLFFLFFWGGELSCCMCFEPSLLLYSIPCLNDDKAMSKQCSWSVGEKEGGFKCISVTRKRGRKGVCSTATLLVYLQTILYTNIVYLQGEFCSRSKHLF